MSQMSYDMDEYLTYGDYMDDEYEFLLANEIEKVGSDYYWETKDGTTIQICKMTDSHLENTIRFLMKKEEYEDMLSWQAYVKVMDKELENRELFDRHIL